MRSGGLHAADPGAAEVALLRDLDDVAVAFCVDPDGNQTSPPFGLDTDDVDAADSRVLLGDKLLAHPLTRAVLVAVGDRPRSWPSAVKEILERAPQWGRTYQVDPDSVERALAQYLWLLSEARRRGAAGPLPLFGAEIQLWIREVSRLLRTVDPEPSFRWRDSAALVTEDGPVHGDALELPSTYCRRCGMSGWIAIASETSDAMGVNPTTSIAARCSARRWCARCCWATPPTSRCDGSRRPTGHCLTRILQPDS